MSWLDTIIGAAGTLGTGIFNPAQAAANIADPSYDAIPGVDFSGNNVTQPQTTPQVDGTQPLGAMYFDASTGTIGTNDGNGTWGHIAPSGNTQFTANDGTSYSSQAEADARNGLYTTANTQKNNIYNTGVDTANSATLNGRNSIMDYIDSLRAGQSKIDLGRTNVIRSQMRNVDSAQQMVGNGIRSGGISLSNRNAVDSSATEQIARAYGTLGNRQIISGNDKAIDANASLDQEQLSLGIGSEKQKREFWWVSLLIQPLYYENIRDPRPL